MAAEKEDKRQTRVFLWAWPRSISTAVEKCLSFVEGVQTWHEPYTVPHIFELLDKAEKANETTEVTAMMTQYKEMMLNAGKEPNEFTNSKFMPISKFNYPFVKDQLEQEEPGKQYIFIKDMAATILNHMDALPDVPSRHTFIIRHPYRCLVSQRKMFLKMSNYQGDPDQFDMFSSSPILSQGYYCPDAMYLLWKNVQETGKDPNPIVIDAEDIMNHPDKILPKYLEKLGIPFHEKYLTWDESEDSLQTWKGVLEQVIMGKRMGVFDKAFKSSRFLPNTHSPPAKEDLSPDIMKVADLLLPGYEEMFKNRIKPE